MKKLKIEENGKVTLTNEELINIINSAFADGYNTGVERTSEEDVPDNYPLNVEYDLDDYIL